MKCVREMEWNGMERKKGRGDVCEEKRKKKERKMRGEKEKKGMDWIELCHIEFC